MALIQALTTSFLAELPSGLMDFDNPGGNQYKLALFRATALIAGSFGAGTTNYSQMGADEASGTNYSAGGSNLTSVSPAISGTTVVLDFADLVFANVTIVTSGALIYNSTNGNRAVCVLNFGGDKTVTADDLTITFPTPDALNAIIRFST